MERTNFKSLVMWSILCLNQVKQAVLDHWVYTWVLGRKDWIFTANHSNNGQDVSRRKTRHLENLSRRCQKLHFMVTGICISFSIMSLIPLSLVKIMNKLKKNWFVLKKGVALIWLHWATKSSKSELSFCKWNSRRMSTAEVLLSCLAPWK